MSKNKEKRFFKYKDIVLAFDVKRKVTYAYFSDQEKEIFSGQNIKRKKHADIFSSKVNLQFEEAFELCKNGQEADFIFSFQDHWLQAFLRPAKSQGKFSGVIEIIKDITEEKKYQQKYQASKAFTENLIDTANVMIVGLDTKGRINMFNKFAETLTGYERSKIIGKIWFDLFIPEEEKEKVFQVHESILKTKENFSSFENYIIAKDGSKRLINWNNTLTYDNTKKLKSVLSIGTDITERKKIEESVKENEKQKIKILNLIPHAVFELENGKISFANASVANIFGYKIEELQSKNFSILHSKKEKEEIEELVYSELEKREIFYSEFSCLTKTGKEIVCNLYATKVNRESNSTKLVIMYDDITEKKQVVDEIKRTKERYESLYEEAPNSYFTIQEDMKILRLNLTAEKMLGYKRKELLGKNFIDIFSYNEINRKKLELIFKNAKKEKAVNDQEMRIRNKKGDLTWVSLTARFVRDFKTNKEKFHMVLNDTSRRKEAELMFKEKNEELSQINKLMVGRELKMIELKNQISEMEKKLHDLRNKTKE